MLLVSHEFYFANQKQDALHGTLGQVRGLRSAEICSGSMNPAEAHWCLLHLGQDRPRVETPRISNRIPNFKPQFSIN